MSLHSLFFRPSTTPVLILLVIAMSILLWREFGRTSEIRARQGQLASLIAEREEEVIALEERREFLQSELFVEQEARLKLGLRKPDETLYIVESRENPRVSSEPPQVQKPSFFENPARWWSFLFHRPTES